MKFKTHKNNTMEINFLSLDELKMILPLCIDNCEVAKFNYIERNEQNR